jgi:ABC-type uncharacterized transport system permease subunit
MTPLMLPDAAGLAAALIYLGSAALYARRILRAAHETGWLRIHSAAAALLHAASVAATVMTPAGPDLGIFAVASGVSLLCVAFVLVATLTLPVASLLLLLNPLAAGCTLAAVFLHSGYEPAPLGGALLAHVLLSLSAYSVLLLAACQALLLALQERLLRRSRSLAILRMMPALTVMEDLLSQVLWAGLALLSLAIASGLTRLDDIFAQRVVHHTVLSLASWLVFATLLWGRYTRGWRGGTAVAWTLSGFACLGLAYFGAKIVLELILS